VLGHFLEVPALALADRRRAAGARVSGAGLRVAALTAAIAAGLGLGVLALSTARPWL
jgi:hypothetical protein